MNPDHASTSVPIGRGPSVGDDPSKGIPQNVHATMFHTPLIDIHEEVDGLILEADLPGVSEGQVTIQLEENVLSLHARITSTVPEGARVLHQEYRPGDFYRSFILSDEVERSKIAASVHQGVLRLSLPKAERVKTRRIEIQSR